MPTFPIPEHLAKKTFPLWNGPAPLDDGKTPDDIPSLTPFLPEKGNQPVPALLIVPGGGYVEYGFDDEVYRLAERYQKQGVATFFVRYRLARPGCRYPVQLFDVQRALRILRHRAGEWNLDPARVVVMGFSAGGHLASMLETHADAGNPAAPDPIDRQSARPDAAVLVYPVISFVGEFAKNGTSMNLLDANPDPALLERISSDTQVRSDFPPTLLVHTEDDTTVSIDHSRAMYAALQKARVPSAFHIYPNGKHGFGCWNSDESPPHWLELVDEWLASYGFSA